VGSVTLGTDTRAANTDPTCSSPIAGPRRLLSVGERQPASALMALLLRTINGTLA
jgi:hypothetical protein